MSLFQRNRLLIFLHPDRIEFVHIQNGREEKSEKPCQPIPGEAPWKTSVDALPAIISDRNLENSHITVVLSNAFVRFAMLPWSPSLNNAEEEAFARIWLEKTYPDMCNWRIKIDSAYYGRPMVATAVHEDLLASIIAAFDGRQAGLASIQPFLMYAFNKYRKCFVAQSFIFGMKDSSKVCLASASEGKWLGVRNVNCETSADSQLLTDREILARGMEPGSKKYWLSEMPREQEATQAKMPPLSLEYCQAIGHRKRILSAVVALELLLATFLAYRHLQLENTVIMSQSSVEFRNPGSGDRISHEAPPKLKADLKFARNVISTLSTPWSKIFNAIEHSLGENVALLAIEPDTQARSISISAESKDYTSMLHYADRLSKEPLFSSVHIVSHQIQKSDPQKPVRFFLSVNLKNSNT